MGNIYMDREKAFAQGVVDREKAFVKGFKEMEKKAHEALFGSTESDCEEDSEEEDE